MDSSFIQARIDATQGQIIALEDASLALATGAIQSYSLDTGQSRQTVTKVNITELKHYISGLYNRCATLEARRNGSGTVTQGPGW